MPNSPTLDDVRTDVRAALLDTATAVVSVSVDQAADAKRLADLASAYVDLGGALLDALADVSAEDFPPRLAGLVPLLNDLETAYRA
jgi:hypothetical protein